MYYKELTEKWFLEREYVTHGKTMTEIARVIGCNTESVRRAIRRHGIPVKTALDYIRPDKSHCISKKQLKDLYVKQRMTIYDISKTLNCPPRNMNYPPAKDGWVSNPINSLL